MKHPASRIMRAWLSGLAFALASLPQGAMALELKLPSNAQLTAERDTGPDRYIAPVGVFSEGVVAQLAFDGEVRRAAWRLEGRGLTPLQIVAPLRAQLVEAGFEIVLDCAAEQCGGFDFRFAVETLPGPAMYVNVRAYHFITAVRGEDDSPPTEAVTILASASSTAAYLQIIRAGTLADSGGVERSAPVLRQVSPAAEVAIPAEGELAETLLAQGNALLPGLDFGSGTSKLQAGEYPVLGELAAFVKNHPDLRVALVGHTDTVGSLAGNISLSRQRARSVRERLIQDYGLEAGRLDAEGMGYLSPVASNLTPEGREANRRVEAVVLPSE